MNLHVEAELEVCGMSCASVQVGCSTPKVDLHSANLLTNLQRWLVIRDDISSFLYVAMMLNTSLHVVPGANI